MARYLMCAEAPRIRYMGLNFTGAPCRCGRCPHHFYAITIYCEHVDFYPIGGPAWKDVDRAGPGRGARRFFVDRGQDTPWFVTDTKPLLFEVRSGAESANRTCAPDA